MQTLLSNWMQCNWASFTWHSAHDLNTHNSRMQKALNYHNNGGDKQGRARVALFSIVELITIHCCMMVFHTCCLLKLPRNNKSRMLEGLYSMWWLVCLCLTVITLLLRTWLTGISLYTNCRFRANQITHLCIKFPVSALLF